MTKKYRPFSGGRGLFLSGIILLFGPVTLLAATYGPYDNTTSGTLTNQTSCGAGDLARTFNVTDDFTINDLNVGLNLAHSFRGMVRVNLTSPGGTTVTLIRQAGGGFADNFDLMLDDAASGVAENNTNDDTAAPNYDADRSVIPNNALSAFYGENAQGIWSLALCNSKEVSDNIAQGDRTMTFNSARLLFDSLAAPTITPDEISGTVFQDYDADARIGFSDDGIGNIAVTIYDANGNSATTTTDTSGFYTITAASGGPGALSGAVRVEFALPTDGSLDYLSPGTVGDDNPTTVQFGNIDDGEIINASFNYPATYCQSNPPIAIAHFKAGSGDGANSSNSGFVSMNYDDTGDSTKYTNATIGQIGSTYGLSYQRSQKRLFLSSFLKRHVGMANDPGTVYTLDTSNGYQNTMPVATFTLQGVTPANGGSAIDLGTVCRSAVCASDAGNTGIASDYVIPDSMTTPSIDLDSFAKVGAISYGANDMSEDDQTLWLVNLNQKAIITIDASGATMPGTVNQYLLSDLEGTPSCTNGEFRPFALKLHRGKGYLGGVCDASTLQSAANLHAHVLTFDPEDIASGLTDILDFPLDYSRDVVSSSPLPGVWRPWASTWAQLNPAHEAGGTAKSAAPQPILSDIDFDDQGDMLLAFMDRFSHQSGTGQPYAQSRNNLSTDGRAGGELLKACFDGTDFQIEGSGGCLAVGTDPFFSTTDGPNNVGEFYYGDMFIIGSSAHGETSLGGLVVLPGSGEVASTAFDPQVSGGAAGGASAGFYVNGINYFNTGTRSINRAGQVDRYVQITENGDAFTTDGNFGKASALGDLELICQSAPIEIGNRVWRDTDGDGIQDPDENSIPDVDVRLYDMDNGATLVGTATTATDGSYYFGGLNDANLSAGSLLMNNQYELRIDLADTNLSANTVVTLQNAGGVSNNNNLTDLNDNDAVASGGNAVIAFTTGGSGENNHTLDFGFGSPVVDLELTKTLDKPVAYRGETVVYTLTASNVSANNATGVEATDVLPAGITLAVDTPPVASQGSYDTNSGVWNIGNLAAGQAVTLTITVTVD